jgi:hypothetical protein
MLLPLIGIVGGWSLGTRQGIAICAVNFVGHQRVLLDVLEWTSIYPSGIAQLPVGADLSFGTVKLSRDSQHLLVS